MTSNPSPLASLRAAIASSAAAPSAVAKEFARKANSNASHNTYLTPFTAESLARAEQLPHLFRGGKARPPAPFGTGIQLVAAPLYDASLLAFASTLT